MKAKKNAWPLAKSSLINHFQLDILVFHIQNDYIGHEVISNGRNPMIIFRFKTLLFLLLVVLLLAHVATQIN